MRHHRHAAVDLSMRFSGEISRLYDICADIYYMRVSIYIYIDRYRYRYRYIIYIYICVYLYMCKDLVIKW